MTKKNVAIFQMLCCSVLWSIAGIFIKMIDWNPLVIAGFRSLFAAITALVFALITKQKIFFSKNIAKSMFFLAATFLCFVGASKLTTSANAIVLQFTAPIFIMLFSAIFRHQKFSAADILTVVVTLGGISLFALDGLESGHTLGNLLGLCAGLFMAGMFISVGDCKGAEKTSGLFFGHLLTAAIGIPFMFVFPTPLSVSAISGVVILGVVQLGIPYILLAVASENCPPLACSLLSAAEPLLNPVWVALFAKEYPSALSLVGGAVVIVTVTVWCIIDNKRTKTASI